MRKIEQSMVQAIKAGKNWHSGNTAVHQDASGAAVYLHNNQIAFMGEGETRWTLAGWNTPTTRSRINALARAFNWAGVSCKQYKPHCNGAPIDAHAWVDAMTGKQI